MIQKVTMPALGETVDSSTIERWLKKEGDQVNTGDILCEITTDKATLEVENYYRGTLLKILAPAGAELPVGAVIAIVGSPGDKIPEDVLIGSSATAPAPATAQETPAPAADTVAAASASAPAGRLFASPRARRRASELGVALATVKGTGPNGRIVEADVEAAAPGVAPVAAAADGKASPLARKMAAREGVDLTTVAGTGFGGRIMKTDVVTAAQAPAARAVHAGTVVPLTAMRRIVAERMLESKRTIPCYYLQMEADMTDLACLRNKLNLRANGGPKVSFNDFIIKACGLALKGFPQVNSRWREAGIERRGVANVGLAVALDEGLIVPVVRDADRKTLRGIARETADLAQRARSKRLLPDEYQDGCITLSNLGMFGIRSFIPVVNPGESSILGLGVIQDRVVYRQGGIQVRKMMTLTLSVDHRIVDGAVGAHFLEAIRDALEAPQRLVQE